MFTKKERERYNEDRQRACDRLGITKNDYNWFRREGSKLQEIYTDYCNGDIESQEDYEDRTTRLEFPIYEKAKGMGLYVFLQTDPRGTTIYLDKQPIPENNYTQAVCVY